jgi:putative tryptophan/tyrosine transport system substrate-binding protein
VILLDILEDRTMQRRTIGLLITFALAAAPLAAVGQPARKVPTIGFLNSFSATAIAREFEAFMQGLRELGYIEGQSIAIEQRYAEGRVERLPALAAELAKKAPPRRTCPWNASTRP